MEELDTESGGFARLNPLECVRALSLLFAGCFVAGDRKPTAVSFVSLCCCCIMYHEDPNTSTTNVNEKKKETELKDVQISANTKNPPSV